MAPAAVVDRLDPTGDGVDRDGTGGEVVALVELGLRRGAEAFLLSDVPARGGPPDRQSHVDLIKLLRGVLATEPAWKVTLRRSGLRPGRGR